MSLAWIMTLSDSLHTVIAVTDVCEQQPNFDIGALYCFQYKAKWRVSLTMEVHMWRATHSVMFMSITVVYFVITMDDTFRFQPDCAFRNETVLFIYCTGISPDNGRHYSLYTVRTCANPIPSKDWLGICIVEHTCHVTLHITRTMSPHQSPHGRKLKMYPGYQE